MRELLAQLLQRLAVALGTFAAQHFGGQALAHHPVQAGEFGIHCIGQAMAKLAPGRLDGLILSGTWLKACRYMTALFGARRAILDCDPQAFAALSILSAYQPRWIQANWHIYDDAIDSAPTSDHARTVMRERIDALLGFDGTADIEALPMPVMVMGARDDMVVPVYHQEAIVAALPGARRSIMETGGHLFPVSRPDIFTAAVAEWVGEL